MVSFHHEPPKFPNTLSVLPNLSPVSQPKDYTELPDEIWANIFKFLKPSQAAVAARLARRLHAIFSDNMVWKEFYYQRWRSSPFPSEFYQEKKGLWKILYYMEHNKEKGHYAVHQLQELPNEQDFIKVRKVTSLVLSLGYLFCTTTGCQLQNWHLESQFCLQNVLLSGMVSPRIVGCANGNLVVRDALRQAAVFTQGADGNLRLLITCTSMQQVQCHHEMLFWTSSDNFVLNITNYSLQHLVRPIRFHSPIHSFKVVNGHILCMHMNKTMTMAQVSKMPKGEVCLRILWALVGQWTARFFARGFPDFWKFDSQKLVAAWKDKNITVIDLKTSEILYEIKFLRCDSPSQGANGNISAFDFDGRNIAIGLENGILTVIDVNTLQWLLDGSVFTNEIKAVILNGDRCWIFGRDGVVKMWDLTNPEKGVQILNTQDLAFVDIIGIPAITSYSLDGRRLAVGDSTGGMRILDFHPKNPESKRPIDDGDSKSKRVCNRPE